MTGSLLPTVVWRVIDTAGKPVAGALLHVFLSGTTTATPSYTNAGLTAMNPNPVVADGSGLFPPIFLDPTITYRLRLADATDAVLAPDVDPYSPAPNIPNASITAAMLAPNAVTGALGFTPLNAAGDDIEGELVIDYQLTAPPQPTSIGFRGAPLIGNNSLNVNYNFGPDDAGRSAVHGGAVAHAWTIDPDTITNLPIGSVIIYRNIGTGVATLTRGAGVSLVIAGSGTSKDVAIAQWGFGTLFKDGHNSWLASGSGLS